MSFRLALLQLVEAARSISGPAGLDIRTNQLTIRKRTWSGARVRQGTSTDVDLVLPAHYPIRLVSEQELNSAAGQYEMGDILVDHITPSDGDGVGYTPADLHPTVTTNNVELIYVINGAHAGEYSFVELRTFRPFTYQLVLRRSTRTP